MWPASEIAFVRDEIRALPGMDKKPRGGVRKFVSRIGHAASLSLREKELLVFALLQWAAIAMAYFLWVQMLGWIPEEVWRSAAESDQGSIADWVLLAWSVVCVGLAAFPVGILTGCMGAAHFLHRQGRESTIAACLKTVLPRSGALWSFHWIDGWITVSQILERLPKKRGRRTPAQRAASEALYYAWKLGVAGVLPSIVTGNDLVASARNSVSFVKHGFLEIAALRAGYSALCWVVGIASYVGALVFLAVADVAPASMYAIYVWAGVPALAGVGAVMLFLRPVYVLALCDLYSEYLESRNEPVVFPEHPAKPASAIVAFATLCLLAGVAFVYRSELGIMDLLATPYGEQRQRNAGDAEARFRAAMAHYDAKRFDAAAAGFQQVLQAWPDDALAHARLGFSYIQMARYKEAVPHLQRAVELNAADAITWSNLGLVHDRLGRPEQGIEPLRTAARLRPDNPGILANYGFVLRRAGRLDDALVPLRRAASIAPEDPATRFNLGMVYAAKGERAAALSEAAIVRAHDPGLAAELEQATR